jgi:hypothetical protein
MKRWLFNLLAGLSLPLGIIVGVVWIISYFGVLRGPYRIPWGTDYFNVKSIDGSCRFYRIRQIVLTSSTNPEIPPQLWLKPVLPSLQVPYWTMLVPLAVVFALSNSARRLAKLRQLRLSQGLCLVCGYDLRATPDRCPECGTISAAEKGAAT